nr:PrgH/EprH family type III secretion apparatus protein [uncultured Enterobacter sp.]
MHENYVLKILSGPMFGVDVALPDESIIHLYFGDNDTLANDTAGNFHNYALNSLLIPGIPGGNEKFLLRLRDDNGRETRDGETYTITAQRLVDKHAHDETDTAEDIGLRSEDGDELIHIPLNEPTAVGQVVIALREASQTWSDSVTHYRFPFSAPNGQAPQGTIQGDSVPQKRPWLLRFSALVVILAGCALIAFLVMLPNKIVTLREALIPVNPEISQTKDGRIFILANTLPEATWAEMALRKSELLSNNITLLSVPQERDKLKALLVENVVPFFDVKFTRGFTLRLLISRERSPADPTKLKQYEQRLQKLLLGHFPYINAVNIERVSDSVVYANARDRLKALGIHSQKDVASQHITLNISGELDDFQLSTLRHQVSEFTEQYGDQYVKFVVNMNEDPLRNRTFKTGADSYIVVPGNHWLYSDITASHTNY